jgi:hypothetical protein
MQISLKDDEKTEFISMDLLPSNLSCVPLEKDVVDKPKLCKCNLCDNTFSSPKEKKDHNSKVHPKMENKEKKIYECQVEGFFKKFTTRNGLKYQKSSILNKTHTVNKSNLYRLFLLNCCCK